MSHKSARNDNGIDPRKGCGNGKLIAPCWPWRTVARATCPQKCMCVPTKLVELAPGAPHYAQLSGPDSGTPADSSPWYWAKTAQRGELFITPRLRGTLHDQARCMNSLAKVRCSRRFFHIGSLRYATLARVLHGVANLNPARGGVASPC